MREVEEERLEQRGKGGRGENRRRREEEVNEGVKRTEEGGRKMERGGDGGT